MPFKGEEIHTDLGPNLKRRVLRNEPLARHSTFGVGGPADIWVSLETSRELIDLVSLCSERQWPLLLVGNGTNVLYADAGMRGIVARIALNAYSIEDRGDGTPRLLREAGVSWPRLLDDMRARDW